MVETPIDFLVARLACLMRLYTPRQGAALREALRRLDVQRFALVKDFFILIWISIRAPKWLRRRLLPVHASI